MHRRKICQRNQRHRNYKLSLHGSFPILRRKPMDRVKRRRNSAVDTRNFWMRERRSGNACQPL